MSSCVGTNTGVLAEPSVVCDNAVISRGQLTCETQLVPCLKQGEEYTNVLGENLA